MESIWSPPTIHSVFFPILGLNSSPSSSIPHPIREATEIPMNNIKHGMARNANGVSPVGIVLTNAPAGPEDTAIAKEMMRNAVIQ